MNTKVIKASSLDEFESEILKITSFTPTLAFIFASYEHDLEHLSLIGDKNNIKIFGATTSGEIANDEIFESSIVAMFVDISNDDFEIYYSESSDLSTIEISDSAFQRGKEKFNNPAFLVASSGLSRDGEDIISPFIRNEKDVIPVFGGLAGDNLNMKDTFVFTNSKCTNNGLVFLILNGDKVEVNGMAISGWEAIGVEKIVTRSEGNIVYEIEGKPALDVYINYFDLSIDLDDHSDVVATIGVNFPLQVLRKNSNPVLRAPLFGNKDDRSLAFAGKVPQGAKVKFSVPPTFEIIDTTIDIFKSVKGKMPDADAMIMFSCAARKLALGPMTEDEIEGLRKLWNAPMVGMFTYGEIGNSFGNVSDFHNETCSLVLLKSKN